MGKCLLVMQREFTKREKKLLPSLLSPICRKAKRFRDDEGRKRGENSCSVPSSGKEGEREDGEEVEEGSPPSSSPSARTPSGFSLPGDNAEEEEEGKDAAAVRWSRKSHEMV